MSSLAVALFAAIAAAAGPSSGAVASPVRRTMELTDGWRFIQSNELSGAQRIDYPDASWTRVSLPHTWNRVGYYKPNPDQHINRADNINKTEGIGWYRLAFRPPPALGKKAWLEFDAASRTAEVWLNGKRIGQHRGGFSRFRFDVTSDLLPGSNLLAVKVDNSRPSEGSPTADVLPLAGDFFVRGGLYRPARLVLTDPVHFDMMDFGGPGIYASTASVDPAGATIDVDAKLRNDSRHARGVTLAIALIDASGNVAARSVRRMEVRGDSGRETRLRVRVPRAHLWQGVADPYLYTLRAQVRATDGRLLDALDQPIGIRIIRLDPQLGLFLNGRRLRLHGVGLHQDFEGKGWALTARDVASTFAIIREMGANAIRLTHYQHGQPIHDLADRYGLIVWDEIPLVNSWTLGKDQAEPTSGLVDNARQQLQELIYQDYNHPSVAVWSIANEVDFGAQPPGGGRLKVVPDPVPLLRQLKALAKSVDPTRPTVLANCCEERGMASVPPVEDAVDANGANRYFGWYYGKPQDLGAHLDLLRAKRPWQPLAVTEYGAGGATTIHTDNPLGGPVDAGGRDQPEEYQSWLHEQTWPIIKSKPYLWASFVWNAFDFASTSRHEGDSQDINTKGLVTYDRKIRKDAYYFYRANWTTTPTVHINGRRYVERAYPVVDVRVYSNAPSTELLLNGISLGTKSRCPDDVCVWPNVRLAAGQNLVLAAGTFAGSTLRDSVAWHISDRAAHDFRIDSGALVGASSASGRFGSDSFFEGGRAATIDGGRRGSSPVLAAIAGSSDRDLVATYREGDFHYRIPVENGGYRVRLTFIEPSSGRTRRIFNVLANGRPVLSRFDILAAAGAPLAAVQRQFDVTVSGQMLDLHFEPVEGQAVVSAVEVTAEP